MQKCTNCKKPIPDGAKFCGHCGKTTYFEPNQPQQPPFVQYQVQPYSQDGQPLTVADETKTKVKPNCDLSVAGFILSIFSPYLCVISFILCISALVKKQIRRTLAIVGLIISLIEILSFAGIVYLVYFMHVDISQYIPFLAALLGK